MVDLEALYARLPVTLQNAACSIEGWRIERSRLGREFSGVRAAVDRRSELSQENAALFRDARLRAFLAHAFASVPFYKAQLTDLGLDINEINGLRDLSTLPILEKATVQANGADFVSTAIPERERVRLHTSGTTGGGLRFYSTVKAVREQWATYWRYWGWHGLDRSQLCAYFGGRSVVPADQTAPPFWRTSIPQKRLLFSAHHMSPDNLDAYLSELRRRRPPWLHGYPSLIALVAAHLLSTGSDLGYSVRWVTAGAENLTPHQASIIEHAFGVRPRQHYGSTEAVAQFSECEVGSLHVDEDFAAVEFVPDGEGRTRVIGTNMTNLATPLIRYDVGDLADVSEAPCQCGKPGRIVERVDGRLEDYVVRRNGARVAALNHVFKDMVRVREAQLYQNTPGEVTIRVVPAEGFSKEDELLLLSETRKRLGADMIAEIELCSRLARTATGKLRLVVSDLSGSSM
jgi:phenylacetate-CoA ligase